MFAALQAGRWGVAYWGYLVSMTFVSRNGLAQSQGHVPHWHLYLVRALLSGRDSDARAFEREDGDGLGCHCGDTVRSMFNRTSVVHIASATRVLRSISFVHWTSDQMLDECGLDADPAMMM